MATWTLRASAGAAGAAGIHYCASDGNKIYFKYNSDSVIKEYDPSTHVVTQIGDRPTDFPSDTSIINFFVAHASITWFKGSLYSLLYGWNAEDTLQVWRWDGSPHSWTKVLSTNAYGDGWGLFSDDTHMVVIGEGVANATAYTTDGTSWTQGSFDGGITPTKGGSTPVAPDSRGGIHNGVDKGIITNVATDVFGARSLFQWNNGTTNWDLIATTQAWRHQIADPNIHFTSFSGGGDYRWTTDFVSFTQPTDYTIIPVAHFNLPYAAGWKVAAGGFDIYYWNNDTPDWEDVEELTFSNPVLVLHIIRTDDDEVYAFVKNSSNNCFIFQRDEIIPDPSPPAPAYTIGAQPFDIDADGAYLYVGVLVDGIPKLVKINSGLSSISTEFNPGDGSSIRVRCGDYDSGIVWVAGDFGSTDSLMKYDSVEGIYWTSQNPTWWPLPAGPLQVGPGDDNLVMIPTNPYWYLHENYFVGDLMYWTTRNWNLPFDVGALDRWDINIDELLIGNEDIVYFYADSNIVEFSPNIGQGFGDVSDGLSGINVTSLIVG